MNGRAGPSGAAERILVIKLGALGDMVLALGPFSAIRKHHSSAFITLLTTAPYAEIGRRCGFFDEVLVDDRPSWRDPGGWIVLARRLRAGGFDRVYDLQSNDRTALYRRLLWPAHPAWISDPGRRAGQHAFDRLAAMMEQQGIREVPPPDVSFMTADAARFRLPLPYILLAPGAAPHRPAKRWPAHRFGELAAGLAKASLTPVIIGTQPDAQAAAIVAEACPQAIDLVGRTTLFDIPALARGAAGAVGNDTGPMHLIVAARCPSVVLFSSASDPAQSAPKGPRIAVLRRPSLDQLGVGEVASALDGIRSMARDSISAAEPMPNSTG